MVISRAVQVLTCALTAGLLAFAPLGASDVGTTVRTTVEPAAAATGPAAPADLDTPTDEDCAPRQGDGVSVCVDGISEAQGPSGPKAASVPAIAAATRLAVPGVNPIRALVPCVGTGADGKRLVAVYATASGYSDRYTTVLPKIRQWAGQASQEMWFASVGQKYGQKLRWATSTPKNGACALVVKKVVIPAAKYRTATAIWNYMEGHGYKNENAHYIVWVEAPPAGGACGLAQHMIDSQPSAELNETNKGTLFAWISPPCWENVVLHEVLHTLGATGRAAPHATRNAHCTDGADLMCYADGPGVVIAKRCAPPLYVRQPLSGGVDCGKDTYYNQAPARGSYLATHWNVARSPFLQRVSPAPARPAVRWASGPRRALAGTLFTLKSGGRTAPGGARTGSALWLAPAGCYLTNRARATTTAYCSWLAQGVKGFKTVSTDKYGRLGARTVNVSVLRPNNRRLTGTLTRSTLTAKASSRVYVTLAVRDAATGRAVIGVPVRLFGYKVGTNTSSVWASGTTNRSGQSRLSYIQPSVSVGVAGSTSSSPQRWIPWRSRWASIKRG